MKILFVLLTLLLCVDSLADDPSANKIPGVDFTRSGASPSPSPSPSPYSLNAPSSRRRSSIGSNPALGVGGSGNNQGYTAGQGKLKLGF